MMKEACTVHDAVYMYSKPQDINTWTVYTIWNILRNPSTKKYFGFQVDDVDMDMDFTIGRSMAEELPLFLGMIITRCFNQISQLRNIWKNIRSISIFTSSNLRKGLTNK